jgi:hypothetical protein
VKGDPFHEAGQNVAIILVGEHGCEVRPVPDGRFHLQS